MRNLIISTILLATASAMTTSASSTTPDNSRSVTILYTTDIHGHFFPYDFINRCDAPGSLARVASAVDSIRRNKGADHVVLLDNGDILQGQPTVYYYNFIDTTGRHIVADIFDFLGYDAATIGNHDVETGHAVYDRHRSQIGIPLLGANVIDHATGEPYLQPYTIIERGGMRIAVIGLLTPAIPAWLPERLWSGLSFLPMKETARQWVEYVREHENPDFVVGLFHSGHDSSNTTAGYLENESLEIAKTINGFDAVLMGHDHQKYLQHVESPDGTNVWVLNPANNANNLGMIEIVKSADGAITSNATLLDVNTFAPSESYMEHFENRRRTITDFVSEKVTTLSDDMSIRDAYFGPSAFMTLLHRLQLAISGADISMAAPLTFDGSLHKGPLTMADMFTLYKYENTLSTLRLTGREIKDFLEYSYDRWIQTVDDSNPHLIRFASANPTPADNRLKNASYNFDSAYGINYTVDVTKPFGERITITTLADGRQFDFDESYTVAVNSYRAGGGGNHLTDGAGLTRDQIKERTLTSTDKDLRYYLMQQLKKVPMLESEVEANWMFIPTDIANRAATIDREFLFGPNSARNQK